MSDAGNVSSTGNGGSASGDSTSDSTGGSTGGAMWQVMCQMKRLHNCMLRINVEGSWQWVCVG